MRKWYLKSIEEVKEQLDTSENGLALDQVQERLDKYGENVLPSEPPPSVIKIFIQQFKSPLMYILLIAAVVSFFLKEYMDAAFIFIALLLNSVIGTYQEWNAAKSAASLQKIVPQKALVIRDSHKKEIDVKDVVPGDVIVLEAGLRVPADLRLIRANGLEIDESLLTGESLPVTKNIQILNDESIPLGDRTNIAFASTVITRGSGLGIVTATGWSTEIGKIAKVLSAEDTKTPLVHRMESFTKNITVVILLVAAMLGFFAFNKGFEIDTVFFMAIALAVSAIPEGLPIGITVALSIGMRRMAQRHVIVRKLLALEGLGSCTVIASDKTGTLTHNQLTLKIISFPGEKQFEVTGEGYNPQGGLKGVNHQAGPEFSRLKRLAEIGVLCNEATFYQKDQQWHYYGDSVDIAFLVLGEKLGLRHNELLEQQPSTGIIPFDAQLRYAAAFNQQGDKVRVAVKGAYETILSRCGSMLGTNGLAPLDKEMIEQNASQLAEKGYRVLALADGLIENQDNYDDNDIAGLTFLGLVGMIDPLRQEAKAAVRECRQAGVKVCMVTGDHPLTALSIARELDIAHSKADVITGIELKGCCDKENRPEFLNIVNSKTVFSRVEPFQKQLIVKAMMDNGHFVAVTGDGVNDAPALKEANIGVAMGTGTDVAKETADIVLTDDNFASLVAGIEQGRGAYNNIRKIVYLLISMSVAEILLFTFSIIGGYPLPLLAVQILWLNLVTNGIQDIALAFEPLEGDEMKRKPRPPQEGIFERLMIEQTLVSGVFVGIIGFIAWIFFLDYLKMSEFTARNSLLLLLVFFENYHVLNCRSERKSVFRIPFFSNKILIGAVLLAQGLHVLSMNLPIMQTVLSVEPVSFSQWLYTLVLSVAILLVMEVYKFIKQKKDSNRTAELDQI